MEPELFEKWYDEHWSYTQHPLLGFTAAEVPIGEFVVLRDRIKDEMKDAFEAGFRSALGTQPTKSEIIDEMSKQ
jgi:hypothetical protein